MSVVHSVVGSISNSENFKFEDGSSFDAERGRIFADSVMSGSFTTKKTVKPRKEYPEFRRMFWEEPIYNASIANPYRISYDQQFGEMQAHWSRAGKKFSDEPRIAKTDAFNRPGGPDKPEEFPKYSEKPLQYFGHVRQIDPLRVARETSKPIDRKVDFKKLVSELFLYFCD